MLSQSQSRILKNNTLQAIYCGTKPPSAPYGGLIFHVSGNKRNIVFIEKRGRENMIN